MIGPSWQERWIRTGHKQLYILCTYEVLQRASWKQRNKITNSYTRKWKEWSLYNNNKFTDSSE